MSVKQEAQKKSKYKNTQKGRRSIRKLACRDVEVFQEPLKAVQRFSKSERF